MEDFSHLESMGRELKCPICLSLLSSAVSLACNHVFCNSCIMKSMKLDSNCPVCKVPYRRREVRPALHMDNLVSIYKNMEAASGVSIFVTQNAQLTKLSDGENKYEGICGGGNDGGASADDVRTEIRVSKRGRPKKTNNSSLDNSCVVTVKPSCPTKKRVQVPQYPSRKTIPNVANHDTVLEERNSDVLKNIPAATREKPQVNESGELEFRPFFWLREDEDVDKSTQQSERDQLTDTPLPNAPTFSDIMDSEDEMMSPSTKEVDGNPTDSGYDSETFGTQRLCSPELCPSPLRVQDLNEKEKQLKAASENAVLAQATNSGKAKSLNKPKKRGRNAKEKVSRKSAESHPSHRKASETFHQEETYCSDVGYLTVKRTSKRNKKENSVCEATVDLGSKDDYPEKSDPAIAKIFNAEDTTLKNNRKTSKVSFSLEKNCAPASKKRKLDPAEDTKVSTDSTAIEQTNNHQVSCASFPTPSAVNQVRSSILRKADSSGNRNVKPGNCPTLNVESYNKRSQNCSSVLSEYPAQNAQPTADAGALEDLGDVEELLPSTTGAVLHKCKTSGSEIQCAFCHSSECSEASGEMVHYCDGNPVLVDHNGGSRVIHSHKNCVEWAPNVYFEDDKVMNLEAELSRSKRIRCCCCGIKGAALGCFDRSCRKSFHVPCAKLTPQCRWDPVNFVILCPVHASSKLPIEASVSQETRKRSILKERLRKSLVQDEKKQETSTSRTWNQNGRDKMVICFSTLTTDEREIVAKFEKSSGVTILQKWDSRVTHVIASTDENGACRRTLKFLMGILEGKWILRFDWVRACMNAMEHVDEKKYEITVDIHGIKNGPRRGRQRVLNKQPKLFDGFKFYLMGDFAPSYKGYLQVLITAAGGTILHRKPVSGDGLFTLIIYNLEIPDTLDRSKEMMMMIERRKSEAEALALARSTGVRAVSNSWLLNSIAACKLQV